MNPNNNSECKTCKGGMKLNHYGILLLSLFILSTSVYGTYKLILNIINYISN